MCGNNACFQAVCHQVSKKIDVLTKEHYTVKFCARLKKIFNVEKIALLKEAFQNEMLPHSTIHRWHRAFMDGRKSAEIERVSGRPRTVVTDVNINTVSAMTEEDCYSSIRKLADDLHIPRMSIQCVFTKELGKKCVCSMWVPHFLQSEEMNAALLFLTFGKSGTNLSRSRLFLLSSLLTNPKMKCESQA